MHKISRTIKTKTMTNAYSEFRNVLITFDNNAQAQVEMPLDAYKAAVNKVQEWEGIYAKDPSFNINAGDPVEIPMTGTARQKLYSFTVTADVANALYQFVYIETVPNHSELTSNQ